MVSAYLCCDVFTIPTGHGFQFQIELQNEARECLASTESESGANLKTRTSWVTASAQSLAKEVGEDGKSIRFHLMDMPARIQVPGIDLGDFGSATDKDLIALACEMARLGAEARSVHNHVLENVYARALSRLSRDGAKRTARYYDQLQSHYGPLNTLCKAANAEAWGDLLELVRLLDCDRARRLTRMLSEVVGDAKRGRPVCENRTLAIWNLAGELDYFDIPTVLKGAQLKAAA